MHASRSLLCCLTLPLIGILMASVVSAQEARAVPHDLVAIQDRDAGAPTPAISIGGPAASDPHIDLYRKMARKEAEALGVPVDLAETVMMIESDFNAARIGRRGERGLMQVRLQTAFSLGFEGSADDLSKPETNVHFGMMVLARAWKKSHGGVCQALATYAAGHGAEAAVDPQAYCAEGRARLITLNSPLADRVTFGAPYKTTRRAKLVDAVRGPEFWTMEETRVKLLTSNVHARWEKLAAR